MSMSGMALNPSLEDEVDARHAGESLSRTRSGTGIQVRFQFKFKTAWIPASAGMSAPARAPH
jgi:hypothetical protein